MAKRSDKEILLDIQSAYMELSPENLNWDGERDPDDARIAYQQIHIKLRVLFMELGREVTETQAYGIGYGK